MRFLKNVFSQFHRWVAWALISAVFWGWIFGIVTDTSPARKVTLYAQVDAMEEKALALALEAEKPASIKMVKAHPFSYAVFGTDDLDNADIYVVRASEAENYLNNFIPLDEAGFDPGDREVYRAEGKVYGVKAFDAASGEGAALAHLDYDGDQDCYLFFNRKSVHLAEGDGAALEVAGAFLDLD
ncbi:MAG: hypothetical protein IK095_06935 [Oscillospiraceae bacterium]|nr:hypothetical protein [Oscillospiraceae bacterium]